MNGLLSRSTAVVAGMCATAAIAVAVLCGIAIHGLDVSAEQAEAINEDEVATTSRETAESLAEPDGDHATNSVPTAARNGATDAPVDTRT
jgi:NAD/NADP transhydrogenase alpha subunit